jgi:hypothetical protein
MLCFVLDSYHIREYVKHPRALFADLLIGEAAARKTRGKTEVAVTSRLPLLRETSPGVDRKGGWKSNEVDGNRR